MSEVYVDEEIINFLFEQLKISLKEKIKEKEPIIEKDTYKDLKVK